MSTSGRRKDLRNDRPTDRTPTRAESDNIQPNEDNCSPCGSLVVGPVVLEGANESSDEDEADGHDGRAYQKERATTELVNSKNGRDC